MNAEQKTLKDVCESCKREAPKLFKYGLKFYCASCYNKLKFPNAFVFDNEKGERGNN